MGVLFGTDGIRGVANTHPMTVEMAIGVGRVLTGFFKGDAKIPKIVIGQDTRISGDMLASALAAGICSAGGDALLYGVIPTPAVAYYTAQTEANAGIVISASHNPYYDNGIKVFGKDGYKLSDDLERALEAAVLNSIGVNVSGTRETGRIRNMTGGVSQYADFLTGTFPRPVRLNGMKIVLDCANGATFEAAPLVYEGLGAQVTALFVSPDGININAACGSQHPEFLIEKVLEMGADVGLAFDGDGDRLIAVDETGAVLTGDRILAVCANYMRKNGLLKNDCVVTTVMSNLGFKAAMKDLGITNLTTGVGDRYVMEKMRETGATLGGEDSGHMIFLDHHTTGDGILAGLQLIEAMVKEKRSLSALGRIMTVFPQVLINVTVKEKPPIESVADIQAAIQKVTTDLGDHGRVLVRYSGTQPMCRVMVEGPTQASTQQYCETIAEQVRESLG